MYKTEEKLAYTSPNYNPIIIMEAVRLKKQNKSD